MKPAELLRQRLHNQGLSAPRFNTPSDVVRHLGAVQAQDYDGARWALGQRMASADAAAVERAFNAGAIVRTHILRPTWHFVAPADLRWMLSVSAPRVHAANAHRYRQLGLDSKLFARSHRVFEKALASGTFLTRQELRGRLQRAGIPAEGQQLAYIVMQAELDGLICSGPRRGKQFTYALLEDRVPPAPRLAPDEALAELVWRYFSSHGPANVRDFVWWSWLTGADARRGLDMLGSRLQRASIGGRDYWFPEPAAAPRPAGARAHLLPNYDEYGSYRDRDAYLDPENERRLFYWHPLVVNGRMAGGWKRSLGSRSVRIELQRFEPLSPAAERAVAAAARRYAAFLGLEAELA
jgi:hypothetical protein